MRCAKPACPNNGRRTGQRRLAAILAADVAGYLADMAACCAQMGDGAAAEAHAAEVLRLKPDFSAEAYVGNLPYRESEDRDHHRDGLRKAGLPE